MPRKYLSAKALVLKEKDGLTKEHDEKEKERRRLPF